MMFASRYLQAPVRRVTQQTARSPYTTARPLAAFALPRSLTRGISSSSAKSTVAPSADANTTGSSPSASELLVQQRLRRPTSPHLGIYQPQITWIASSLNRITGSVLSGGFYVFGTVYLIGPVLFGWDLSSASLVAAVAGLGAVSKFVIKLGVAWPFVFHSLNGVRHLVWDMGMEFGTKQVQRTGWAVIIASTVLAGGMAMIGGGAAVA